MANKMNASAFKRHWPCIVVKADAADGQPDPNTQPQQPDLSTMQTLVDGTAQQLCLRIWQQYVTQNLMDFPAFMQAVDQTVTQYAQLVPQPPSQNDQEDGYNAPSGEFDLPQIDPSATEDEEE